MTRIHLSAVAAAIALLAGCAMVSDCPTDAFEDGRDVNRFRTASNRSVLDKTPALAQRFAHLAAMSALAYWHEGRDCKFEDEHYLDGIDEPDKAAKAKKIAEDLNNMLKSADGIWNPVKFEAMSELTKCQDEIGLFFRVWRRSNKGRDDVVIAFRGTSNFPEDWTYANLWWVTRFFKSDNQYSRASKLLESVVLPQLISDANSEAKQAPRIVVTGHSLGGGLAQRALYDSPSHIEQAVVFDPSAVTGYVESKHGKEVLCACNSELGTEAKIIRVYESGEILTRLRIWHKIFLPSETQVQEVRLAFYGGTNSVKAHSIRLLAFRLRDELSSPPKDALWYASPNLECTRKIEEAQRAACTASACKLP